MIRAHSVEAVRAAEAAAMAQLPEGELMSRAALGLAEVAAARLDDTDGTTVVGLVGAGDNGGDTLYAVAHLAESGFACAVVLVPAGGRSSVHAAGLAAAEAAGVMVHAATDDPRPRPTWWPRPTSCSTASSASVVVRGCGPMPRDSSTPSTTTPGSIAVDLAERARSRR